MAYRHGITIQKLAKRQKPYLVRWKGEFNFQTGKYRKPGKSFIRKKDAELFAQKQQEELDTGLDPKNRNTQIGEFFDKFLSFKKKEVRYRTYELYKRAIDEFSKFFHSTVPLRKISQVKCEEFLSNVGYIDKNYKKTGKRPSDSTRHQYLRMLKTIFEKAVEWEYIQKNPFKRIKLGTPVKKAWYYIQPTDFKDIIKTVENLPLSIKGRDRETIRKVRLKAFYSIMYGCGLRFGEAANILWDDQNLDFQEGVIHLVNRTGSQDMPVYNIKDYEARSIKMPKFAIEALLELKEIDGGGSPFVFLCQDQWQRALTRWHLFTEGGMQEQWNSKELIGSALRDFKSYCRKAGINTHKKLNLHSLRKGYGSNMAKICPAHTLRSLMGHSSILTTMEFYVQDIDENKKKAVELLDKMMED